MSQEINNKTTFKNNKNLIKNVKNIYLVYEKKVIKIFDDAILSL